MDSSARCIALYAAGATALATSLRQARRRRLELSKAKHRSLTGHARMSRRLASLIPFYEYDEDAVLPRRRRARRRRAQRRGGLRAAVGASIRERFRQDASQLTAEAAGRHFRPAVHRRLPGAVPVQPAACASTCKPASFLQSSARRDGDRSRRQRLLRPDRLVRRQRVRLRLLQGLHRARRSRACAISARCSAPIIRWSPTTCSGCKQISGLDEVSFHMSGTEAVMQAVRLARYHTRRTHLVRFCGAYHGWWGDVQPGIGNPLPARETYTLNDMSRRHAARAAHAQRHRLRAGQSAAGAASERATRRATPRWSTAAAARTSTAPPIPTGCKRLRAGLHRARHRADLRRGVRRLPARAAAARRSTSACRPTW